MDGPADSSEDRCTQLLLRAQKGDSRAFEQFCVETYPAVRDFIASLSGKLFPDECEDLAQETFQAVCRKPGAYRGKSSAKTFALAVAKHLTLKYLSRRKKTIVFTGNLTNVVGKRQWHAPRDSIESSETLRTIRTAMDKLNDAQRRTIELHLSSDSRAAAARADGCTPSRFADRLYHARKLLRQVLDGQL